MRTILTIALLLLAAPARAAIDTSMFIGNSLTNDTVVNRISCVFSYCIKRDDDVMFLAGGLAERLGIVTMPWPE